MHYRREIDGLRAVAVLPVIAFHAGFSLFKGGYVGVDVFFVISGYLITGLLVGDIEAGRFSLMKFYERRARRILPALFVVMAVTTPLAFAVMLPRQFEDFARSLIAVTLFSSNILFWRESGYFDSVSDEKPLLHTWSLAVEEQFYLLFPLTLLIIWRFGRRGTFLCIAAVAVLSLAFSEVAWRFAPSGNFYLAPSRAWELMSGAMVALAEGERRLQRGRGPLAAAGLAMILAAVFLFDDKIPFPSVYTLLPVGGTALVLLHARPGTAIAQLLSRRELVGIGLISYSAYLWHQPLFAIARIIFDRACACGWVMGALALLSLGLAALSWKYVEQPFRTGRPPALPTRRQVFAAAGAGGAAFITLGFVGHGGLVPPLIALDHPDRFLVEARDPAQGAACPGFVSDGGLAECEVVGDGPSRIVVWGDSHLIALKQSIQPEPGRRFIVLTHPGCTPVAGVWRRVGEVDSQSCDRPETLTRYADYLASLKPEAFVLVSRWTLYLNGWYRRDKPDPSTHFMTDAAATAENAPFEAASSRAVIGRELPASIDKLAAVAPVIVLTQAPDLQFVSDRQRVFLDFVPAATIDAWHAAERALMADVAEKTPAHVIDSRALFCDATRCAVRIGGQPLYSDDNHLTPKGTDRQWRAIEAMIEAIEARQPAAAG